MSFPGLLFQQTPVAAEERLQQVGESLKEVLKEKWVQTFNRQGGPDKRGRVRVKGHMLDRWYLGGVMIAECPDDDAVGP